MCIDNVLTFVLASSLACVLLHHRRRCHHPHHLHHHHIITSSSIKTGKCYGMCSEVLCGICSDIRPVLKSDTSSDIPFWHVLLTPSLASSLACVLLLLNNGPTSVLVCVLTYVLSCNLTRVLPPNLSFVDTCSEICSNMRSVMYCDFRWASHLTSAPTLDLTFAWKCSRGLL